MSRKWANLQLVLVINFLASALTGRKEALVTWDDFPRRFDGDGDLTWGRALCTLHTSILDYFNKTGNDIVRDPLVERLKSCSSPEHVLGILQEQAQAFNEFRQGGRRVQLMSKLGPTVGILFALTNGGVLGNAVSLSFPPANAIFAGIGFLLAAAKRVSSSYDMLLDLFQCFENYLDRLKFLTETEIPDSTKGILVKIMVELLDVLALATRQIKQGRFKNFAKKLLGENDVEAVLHRLDRLTMDESRMTAAQTMEVVHGLFNNMKEVMDDGKMSIDNIREILVTMQEILESLNKTKRDELQKSVRQWLSPPDPSINHNVACGIHHKMTATWFTEGVVYKEWKARGSLSWIHGKPGSGKSVLCSTIIEDLEDLRRAGLASLAYYYFDFKDSGKQDRRGLLSSLLVQFSARSDESCEILHQLYLDHEKGSRQPSEDRLIQCLTDVLAAQKGDVYVIIDAVDECPNNYGMPTPREKVLKLLEELVSSQSSRVHFCITSRPEVDIHIALKHLTSHMVSLHDEGGQRKNIVDYINSVIESDPKTRRWREEDKQLVINALARKADGMFRWVFCQFDTLRRCFPGSIRRALDELPSTLDETYERILLGIDEEKWEHAHRLLQCLVVSRRPLTVKELAEVLTIELDARGMPKLNVDLRPRDADQAILSACSTLVAIVIPGVHGHDGDYVYPVGVNNTNNYTNDFWIVQFSHYSVKEFLTSSRLESSRKSHLSRFHVSPEPAHTILAQSCVSTLLQAGDDVYNPDFPLAPYAARNWVDHAQVKSIASHIQIEMETLFDPEKPYFAAWAHSRELTSRNREHSPISLAAHYGFEGVVKHFVTTQRQYTNVSDPLYGPPLYVAVERGNHEVVQLLLEHAADVNAVNPQDYRNRTPLLLASGDGKYDIVQLLLSRGADVNSRDISGLTPLHASIVYGHFDMVQRLIDFGANLNARNHRGATSLYMAFQHGRFDIVQLLLERGADVNSWHSQHSTLLHHASEGGHLNVVRQLINFGANINARDVLRDTPLHRASQYRRLDVVQLLLEQGASTTAQNSWYSTPLLEASERGHLDVVQQLINFGADVNACNDQGVTPLHSASLCGRLDVVQLFLELGVSTNTLDYSHSTPLHKASGGSLYVVQQLIKFGADINAHNNTGATPLHIASRYGRLDVVQLLLEQGANTNTLDHCHSTPLHEALECGRPLVVRQLINFGGDINARNNLGVTPLKRAFRRRNFHIFRLLLELGADVNIRNEGNCTLLHDAVESGQLYVVQQLIIFGADLNIRDYKGATPLLMAFGWQKLGILHLLLEGGANVNLRDKVYSTPLHEASSYGDLNVVQELIKWEADVNARDSQGVSPLHKASRDGHLDIVRLLLQQGANVNTQDNLQSTPLHEASKNEHIDIIRQMIDFGAEVNAGKDGYQTPLHIAVEQRNFDIAALLLVHGADPNPRNKRGCTPLHVASTLGCINVITLLLGRGASVNPREEHLQTPLHLAALSGCADSVRCLLERGADVDARNEFGQTPFSLAMESGSRKCARLISDWGS